MRSPRAAATALVAVLALSACNGGNDPDDPKSSSTPSGNPSAPSTTPPVETLTEAPSGETARQFIRRWVELGNQMQATGETEAFLAVAGPDCDSCEKFADRVATIYDAGGQIKSDGSRVVRVSHDGGDQWTVHLDGSPTEVTDSASGAPDTLPGGPYKLVLYVAKVDGAWVLGDYQDKL